MLLFMSIYLNVPLRIPIKNSITQSWNSCIISIVTEHALGKLIFIIIRSSYFSLNLDVIFILFFDKEIFSETERPPKCCYTEGVSFTLFLYLMVAFTKSRPRRFPHTGEITIQDLSLVFSSVPTCTAETKKAKVLRANSIRYRWRLFSNFTMVLPVSINVSLSSRLPVLDILNFSLLSLPYIVNRCSNLIILHIENVTQCRCFSVLNPAFSMY